jgi:hypothetical protein
MYRISHNKRRFTPTPLVKVETINGKEKETQVLFCALPKEEGDDLLEELVEYLNIPFPKNKNS